MPFQEGVFFELTSYSPKENLTSVTQHTVGDVEEIAKGYRVLVGTTLFDNKGEPSVESQYYLECREDGIFLDISSMLSPESMAAFQSMQVDVTGDALSIPNTMSPGQTLPDGEMHMKASMNGLTLMKLTMRITDRRVTGRETRTTPAGIFECVILEQQTEIEGFGRNAYQSKSWYAKGVGTVRTENYDKKGKLSGYSELTKFGT
jgi:hypothetical protein